MSEYNYPPNSKAYREQNGGVTPGQSLADRGKKEKVTSGKVSTKKTSQVKRATSDFFAGSISSALEYVLTDVIIPKTKDIIFNTIIGAAEMTIFGDTSNIRRDGSGRRIAYDKISNRRSNVNVNNSARVATRRGYYEYDDVIFDSRSEAELVLDVMRDDIDKYGMVSVLDMYDHAGVDSMKHTDCKYGWTNLRNAEIGRCGDGTYYLRLPNPKELAL